MTTMKLELPTDNATVLFHMGEALRSIAVSEGYVAAATPAVKTIGDVTHTVTTKPLVTEETVTPPTAVEQYGKSLADHDEVSSEMPEVSDDTIDANGLPWDARIHSRGKTRLADDTWRNARKPADKDDDEWSAYVAEVEAELLALMEIPVATTDDVQGADIEDITQAEISAGNLVPPSATPPTLDEAAVADTISAEQAFTAPPTVTADVTPPVVTETPPVVTETPPVADVTLSVKTFPELMKFITTNNGKLTKDSVNEVLSNNGLASITLLAARTDLIPQIHADLVKLL